MSVVSLAWNIIADGANRSVKGLPVYGDILASVGAVVTVIDLRNDEYVCTLNFECVRVMIKNTPCGGHLDA